MTGGSGNNRGNSGKSADPLTAGLDRAFESLQSEFGQLLIERICAPTDPGTRFSYDFRYRVLGRVEMVCRIGTLAEEDPFAANRVGVQELVSDEFPTVGEAVADFNEKAERMGKLVKLFRAAEKKVHGIMEDLGKRAREAEEHRLVKENPNAPRGGLPPDALLLNRGFIP